MDKTNTPIPYLAPLVAKRGTLLHCQVVPSFTMSMSLPPPPPGKEDEYHAMIDRINQELRDMGCVSSSHPTNVAASPDAQPHCNGNGD